MRVFHTVIRWWFSQEYEWHQVSSSLQDSSQYSDRSQHAVIWMVSTRPLILSPLVLVPVLWWFYQEHQLQSLSSSLSGSTVFFSAPARCKYFFFFFFFFLVLLCGHPGQQSPLFGKFSFYWLSLRVVEIRWSVCILKSPRIIIIIIIIIQQNDFPIIISVY